MMNLKELNHLLDLNYDDTLNDELLDTTRDNIRAVLKDIEQLCKIYVKEGNYIDRESFDSLQDAYNKLTDAEAAIGEWHYMFDIID